LSTLSFEERKEIDLPSAYQGRPTHDLENLIAAYALCRQVGIPADFFCQALPTFKKPPHRIEYVRTLRGVTYYDDSKGTNVDAVIRAVSSLPRQVVLIAGGVDKGAPYTPWIAPFAGKVKLICAIGAAAPKIQADLGESIPTYILADMEAAVKYATKAAAPNEHVLLSPGCSSFDMYKNYAHRGEEFQRLVHALS
jgi:UDP-N-acetylmuramoylalanine--D-glutamate ligase